MKKMEYVSPEMEVVEIKAQCCILAGSPQIGGEEGPGKGTDPGYGEME